MGNKIHEIKSELDRISAQLIKAENTGQILVHAAVGDETNPYPIFFTAKELLSEIHKGNWHHVPWYLEDKVVMKKEILERISELQKRLIKL